MIKRDALRGRKPFQFTPHTSWMSSIHLDLNGCSFSCLSRSVTGSISSTPHHFPSSVCFFFLPCCFFSQNHSFTSLPSLCSHPHCLPRIHIKAADWFLTAMQAVFFSCFVQAAQNNQHKYGKNLLGW